MDDFPSHPEQATKWPVIFSDAVTGVIALLVTAGILFLSLPPVEIWENEHPESTTAIIFTIFTILLWNIGTIICRVVFVIQKRQCISWWLCLAAGIDGLFVLFLVLEAILK